MLSHTESLWLKQTSFVLKLNEPNVNRIIPFPWRSIAAVVNRIRPKYRYMQSEFCYGCSCILFIISLLMYKYNTWFGQPIKLCLQLKGFRGDWVEAVRVVHSEPILAREIENSVLGTQSV